MTSTEHIESSKEKKKSLMRKKIVLAILTILLALMSLAAFTYSRYLHQTGEIIPVLYAIKTGGNGNYLVNFFIMQVGEKYIAIDAGSDSGQAGNALQSLDIPASDIVAVFVTHDDPDHIAALALFENATIYTGNIKLPDTPHQIMSNHETIELYDVSIQCIYTPGHTSGCVSFLIDDKYLFIGDLIFRPRYNEELQKQNIEKSLRIDGVEYVFTGHFGLFKNVRFFRWWWL